MSDPGNDEALRDEADDLDREPVARSRSPLALIGAVGVVVVVLGTASFALGRSTRTAASPTTRRPPSTTSTTTAPTTTTTLQLTTTSTSTTTTTTAPATTTSAAATSSSTNLYPLAAGAKSQYARSHHDYPAADIFTACGTTFVAPTSGRVDEVSLVDTWSSKVNDGATRGGLSVSIVGNDGVRYYGSHLRMVLQNVRPGTRVTLGQPLGQVGDTGSAKGTGCHLHFGISTPCGPGDWQRRRGQFWPQKYLDAWKVGRQLSAVPEVAKSPC